MVEEQPVIGLDIVGCSGYTGESSSMPSPEPLAVMAETHPICVSQCAFSSWSSSVSDWGHGTR